jgi:sodium-dependent dicarboxylate transporter 2/3/5
MNRPRALSANFVVDTRPLWRILAERTYRPGILIGGMIAFLAVLWMPRPEGLSPAGQSALAVFAVCVLFWVTNVLPLMVTSLLAMVTLPTTGVMPAKEAYSLFGNEAVFFILAAFILAAALMKCGLSTRIAVGVLRRFGHTPRTLLLSMFLMNAFMSFFMSEHAVAAMTFPITLEIAAVLRLHPHRSNYARALFLSLAWGTSIGGVATLLGGGRAPLAIGMLRETTGASFSFLEWSVLAAPLVVMLLVIGWVIINVFFPIDITSVRDADSIIEEKSLRMGRPSAREKMVGAIMFTTLAAWIIGGEEFGLASIGLAAVVVIFLIGIFQWSDLERNVNWGVLLMYGGAIALGAALNRSGAAAWVANALVSSWGTSPIMLLALLAAVSIVLTEAMSNSAVVAFLLPVAFGIAQNFGIEPRAMAPAIALTAGLGFTMPVGTPANAIAYSSGYLRMRDMVVPGALLSFASWASFMLVSLYWWPLIGVPLLKP